jgi:hypothetical protein
VPAGGDRHLAEFLPSILTESSGWGKAWGIELTPISQAPEHQEGFVRDVDTVRGRHRRAVHQSVGGVGGAK